MSSSIGTRFPQTQLRGVPKSLGGVSPPRPALSPHGAAVPFTASRLPPPRRDTQQSRSQVETFHGAHFQQLKSMATCNYGK